MGEAAQTYIFVAEVTPMSDLSRAFVFPPDPSREGLPWGLLIDIFGNDWFREQHRIVNQRSEMAGSTTPSYEPGDRPG